MKKLFLYVQTADGSGWKSHEYTEISELQTKLTEHRIKIHPTATIGDNVYLGDGCNIGSGTTIENDVIIGDMTSISVCVTIHQSANIGDSCHIGFQSAIGAGTRILNNSRIGQSTRIGENVFIDTSVKIGTDCFVASDTVISVPFVGNKAQISDNVRKSLAVQGSMHRLSWWGTNDVSIGCETMPIEQWEAKGRTMARNNGYTDEQITEYLQYLDICKILKNG